MNRNTEQHFATNPVVTMSRSKFDRGHTLKTSMNTGDLVPLYWDDVMPGDTVKMRMSQVVRMATPAVPVMDNANIDIYWFFVPNRLIWDHWAEFMGENKTEPWIQQVEYQIPQIEAPSGGWNKGSLANYLGVRMGVDNISVSALPFRAYCLIWNEWFRSEVLKDPIYITTGDSTTTGKNKGQNYDYVTDTQCGAAPAKVAKYFDYFTAALPNPQRGPSVKVPLGDSAPVIGKEPITYRTNPNTGQPYAPATDLLGEELAYTMNSQGYTSVVNSRTGDLQVSGTEVAFFTDLTQAIGATVNQLRQAFAIQKFYERQARGGTRYIELIKSHYDVTNPDFRFQRPEYLGGERIPINMNQVVQNSESATTPQGTTAAFSCTVNVNEDMFTHSFTEHGIIMCLAAIRTTHTYQQGISRKFNRKKFTDFYFPEFANLGEQAILNKEIYVQGSNVVDADGRIEDEQAFGYQEAWAEYRYMPDEVTGELSSDYAQSLDVWHYGDDYSQLPSLSSEWIDEVDTNVARTLAVQNHDQFIADFYFGGIYTRPMPLYSIPGLIDHH